ncbi:MAG TPA: carbohydrate binding family 9 domain-containing protein, partial [Cellvibrio sp.]
MGAISGVSVQAADAEDKNLHLTRIENPPVIDGKLDEEIWKTAAVITDLRQIRPVDGAPVSARTEVYVAYDKDALYVAARLWDNPQEVTAKIMKQGSSLGEDDRIAVIIDPFNTGRNGYRFEVNANGVRNDMLYQNNRLQPEWTVIWDAAGAITDDGWIAEFAIPFKTLPLDPEINSWGFNVSRAIRRKGEEAVWVSRNRSWNPSIVGSIEGLRDLDQGIGLDIVPGLSLREHKDYEPEHKESDIEPSLDVYYRITPSLSGSLTFNTDFSATEVDERQVNLTRFNLFFPEKRDFFLNDADLFEFGRIGQAGYAENIRSVARTGQENARPFFSRRLGLSSLGTPVDIDYGGKLSGRIGNVTIGTLAIRQDDFVKPDGTVIPASDAFVSRMTADVLEESSIGLIGTSGDPTTGNDNSLVGADFLYLNTNLPGNRVLESEFWFQQTNTPGINGDDTALGVGLRSPNLAGWRGGAGYREIGENFNPALGV